MQTSDVLIVNLLRYLSRYLDLDISNPSAYLPLFGAFRPRCNNQITLLQTTKPYEAMVRLLA